VIGTGYCFEECSSAAAICLLSHPLRLEREVPITPRADGALRLRSESRSNSGAGEYNDVIDLYIDKTMDIENLFKMSVQNVQDGLYRIQSVLRLSDWKLQSIYAL
jgi:hypothetical protein